MPAKHQRKVYNKATPSPEQAVNDIVEDMSRDLDNKLKSNPHKHSKFNLSQQEKSGLKWLEKMTSESKLAIVQADKGGAILIVYPELLKRKVQEKLNDEQLYQKLDGDPTHKLYKKIFDIWVKGKEANHVTPQEAKEVMGVSDNLKPDKSGPTNRPSTLSHYKPGRSYFYPSLKIHKLTRSQLIPGVEPPIRLITALQEGVSKRSDVFLAEKFFKQLEEDYCKDLLKDTTDALKWLDRTNSEQPTSFKKTLRAFTFDFKSLYDSLDPELVKEALNDSMITCRPDWSPEFREWITQLVSLSLESSVGCFDGQWYIQRNGVPTGGSLCVQLANITVYYALNKCVYSNTELMKHIVSIKRYIDDGAGVMSGTKRQYQQFIKSINNELQKFKLFIDEFQIEDPGKACNFLDIKFCFNNFGDLETDLYTKETDARSYLNFLVLTQTIFTVGLSTLSVCA